MEAGMFTVPMDFALPIVRAQRGNRGIAKEKLDPVAEAAKPQWDHKKWAPFVAAPVTNFGCIM